MLAKYRQLNRRRWNISKLRPLKSIDERRLPPRLGPVVQTGPFFWGTEPFNLQSRCKFIEAADVHPRRIPLIRETFGRGNQSVDDLGTYAFPAHGGAHATAFRQIPADLGHFGRR